MQQTFTTKLRYGWMIGGGIAILLLLIILFFAGAVNPGEEPLSILFIVLLLGVYAAGLAISLRRYKLTSTGIHIDGPGISEFYPWASVTEFECLQTRHAGRVVRKKYELLTFKMNSGKVIAFTSIHIPNWEAMLRFLYQEVKLQEMAEDKSPPRKQATKKQVAPRSAARRHPKDRR